MTTKYFEIYENVYIPGRWHLSSPQDAQGHRILPIRYKQGHPLDLQGEPVIPVHTPGLALDFSLALHVEVVTPRFVSLCERLGLQDQVQFIQAQVEGHAEPYFLLNTLRIIPCIDDARCEEVDRIGPEDGAPEFVGYYRNVAGMKIDPTKVGDAHLFRPWGWTVALLVSEHLKRAIKDAGLTGPKFLEV